MLLDQTLKKYRAQEKEESPDGFCLDREQSFDERIDAAIARDIKVLGQIKTMKAIGLGKPRPPATTEPLKQIESPPIQMVEGDK